MISSFVMWTRKEVEMTESNETSEEMNSAVDRITQFMVTPMGIGLTLIGAILFSIGLTVGIAFFFSALNLAYEAVLAWF